MSFVSMDTVYSSLQWSGYLRADGRKGVRNLVLVIYTVECAQHVAHAIAAGEADTHVIGFPGCFDNQYAVRLLLALARHPNVGAVLAVGLGCEYTQPEQLANRVRESGRPADWFFIQQSGGTIASIEKGKAIVAGFRAELQQSPRVEMMLADLVVGSECGGSDFTSGLAGNPAVGRVFDRVVDAGGSAVFEEIVEMIGLRDVLIDRASNDAAREQVAAAYDKAVAYCQSVRQYSISPGNLAGGLTTIEEKSLGALAKSGDRPIQGVLKVSQSPPWPGLWLLDTVPDPHFLQNGYTNPNDTEGIMDLISVGSQVLLFVTGRGSVVGAPVAPLIKITGNSETYRNLSDDVDFNAGRLLTGESTLDQLGDELLTMMIDVARGKLTKPERLGHREYFVMYKHQDSPPLAIGCRA
jgi:altronate hydrolase